MVAFRIYLSVAANYFICLSFVFVFFLVHRYTTHHFNRCDMTYMYRYPVFIDIPMSQEVQQMYPNYALILYGEGEYAERSKCIFLFILFAVDSLSLSLKLTGNPVLFIPGNAGSSKQVRSLGSMMQMKTESGSPNSVGLFNVFAVELDEELCALYGGYLTRQTAFVLQAMQRIYSLYDHLPPADRPRQIILIGHSMGGVVARAVLALPTLNQQFVAVLITLASPHIAAPFNFDRALAKYMLEVNRFWEANTNAALAHLTVASVSGGVHDLLVPSYLTKWPTTFNTSHGMRLVEQTSAKIDYVWAEADHLCIVWCNQLVRVISRALFDMIDPNTKMLTRSRSLQYEVIKWHFVHNRGAKSFHQANAEIDSATGYHHFGSVEYTKDFSYRSLQKISTGPKSKPITLYKLHVDGSMMNQSLFLLTTQDVVHVAFECVDIPCETALPLQHHQLLPPFSRYLHLNFTDRWLGRTLVVPLLHQTHKRFLVFDRYLDDDATHISEIHLSLLDPFMPFTLVNEEISGTVTFRNITLNGFVSVAQVYVVRLIPVTCKEKTYEISAVRLSVQNDPGFALVRHFRFPFNSEDDLFMYLQTPTTDEFPLLQLFLDPACEYRLTIQSTLAGSLFEVIRQFSFILPGIMSFHLLMLCALCELSNYYFHSTSYVLLAKWQLTFAACQYILVLFYNHNGHVEILSGGLLVFVSVSLVNFGLFCCSAIIWMLNFIGRKSEPITQGISGYFPSISCGIWSNAIGIGISVLILCGFSGVVVLVLYFVIHLFQKKKSDNFWTGPITNIDNFIMLIHLLACAFVAPAGIVWIKNLINHGTIQLIDDPSFDAAAVFLVAYSLPFPARIIKLRPIVVSGLGCYCTTRELNLSDISAALAALAGVFMNPAFDVDNNSNGPSVLDSESDSDTDAVAIDTKKDKTD